MSIDRFFTLGPDAPYEAHDVFIDREAEQAWFLDRLHDHVSQEWPVERLHDFQRPARNLVAYVGEGGIGKSTLIRRLANEALTRESPELPSRRACALVDFADASNRDFETVLLRTRAAFGSLSSSWTAFDVGLSVYWSRKHPGQSVVTFVGRSSLLGGAEAAGRLAGQISSTLDYMAGGLGLLGSGYRLVHAIGEKLARSRSVRRMRAEFPGFDRLLDEVEPDAMLGFLPSLLAYDLERTRSGAGALAVCTLDTFEVVQTLPQERGALEDLVSRLVYLMPNVLFLIGSRQPPDWYHPDRGVGLLYGGPDRWRGLSPDPPVHPDGRAHLYSVAGLVEAHAEEYLQARLTRAGTPAIPPQIRERIVAASGGSPHYLELSVDLFERVAARGEEPDPAEFGGPFPGLVLRILRDLGAPERDLLRAASLLEAFDADLLTAMLPAARRRTIEAFIGRSFVRTDPSVWPPYRLHENLRRSVNECDWQVADAWTDGERQDHLRRALELLEQMVFAVWNDGMPASQSADRRNDANRVVAAFVLSLQAAAEHGVISPGLGVQAYTLRELGHWTVLRSLPGFPDQPRVRELAAVARLSVTAAIDGGERYERLREIASQLQPDSLKDPPRSGHRDRLTDYTRFELGNLAFVVGDLDAAEWYFSQIPLDTPGIGSGSLFGRAGAALRRSRFAEVVALMRQASAAPLEQARRADMLGHLEMHNGRFEWSVTNFEHALQYARDCQAPLWIARAVRHLCLATMWTVPDRTEVLLPEARELNRELGDAIGLGQCHLAATVVSAGRGDRRGADSHLRRAREQFAAAGARFEMLPVEVVEVMIRQAAGDRAGAEWTVAAMLERAGAGTPVGPPVWLAVCAGWVGRPDWYPADSIAWLDPAEAGARWHQPLARLRDAQRSRP